jgi:transaldolase
VIQQVQKLGQSFWYDNIQRGLIDSGDLQHLIDLGITGLTSNPTIFQKAIAESNDYDQAILDLARKGKNVDEIYETLVINDIRAAADLLLPVHHQSEGRDGYASLEVSPHLAYDTDGTIREAKRLFSKLGRPNVMVKVPGTTDGVRAIRSLIAEGINVNVTLLFSRDAYCHARGAYIDGLSDFQSLGGDLTQIASVASFFVSRVDTSVDSMLNPEHDIFMGKAAVSNAKLAYRDFKHDFGSGRFKKLVSLGARPQRPLWASTSVKNPKYNNLMYVESLMGKDTVNTMPEATFLSFLEHGSAAETLSQDVDEATQVFMNLSEIGVDIHKVTSDLLDDGIRLFTESFDRLKADIDTKQALFLNVSSG